jgi:hypothetical protein
MVDVLKILVPLPQNPGVQGSHHDRSSFQQFKIVELPTNYRLITKEENGKERTIEEEIFDKSSD